MCSIIACWQIVNDFINVCRTLTYVAIPFFPKPRSLAGAQATLETEVTNKESLRLYGRLGFSRDEVGKGGGGRRVEGRGAQRRGLLANHYSLTTTKITNHPIQQRPPPWTLALKRLVRYYLNGVDAFRLKLWFRDPTPLDGASEEGAAGLGQVSER